MAISSVPYCTREDVKAALDSKETARNNAQVDRAIEQGARAVEGLLLRKFYPWSGTRYLDWPNHQLARPWRLWLDGNEAISVSQLVSGGVTISSNDYFLRRSDHVDEPPYTHIEVDLDSQSGFSAGGTHQRSVAITGVFGHSATEATAGALTAAIASSSVTTAAVSDSSAVGTGSLIKVDSERMLVTNKTMSDTGVNIDAGDSLTASNADQSITMSTTTDAPVEGEVIQIDSERMLVLFVAGSVLTVKRAWDGSTLATHAGAADIYAPRTLTLVRGFVGTTAATHLDDAPVTRHVVPPLVRELAIAESINILLGEVSGYSRRVGTGDGSREQGGILEDLRERALETYGRRARKAAV